MRSLLQTGHNVRAVDIKHPREWHQCFPHAENRRADLRDPDECCSNTTGIDRVYNLACDMGGMGFIESHRADCMVSVLINTNLLIAAAANRVKRYFYASSACVYNADKQALYASAPLREEDAYPAMPEDGYGWEKLFGERMCRHFSEDRGIETRVARLHNVYGPRGTWRGGREKAPAALCRKVLEARASGSRASGSRVADSRQQPRSTELHIWGTGRQTRSFTYIDDCIRGIASIMDGAYPGPVNLGSAELVSIDELVDLIEEVANTKLEPVALVRVYDPGAPRGVAGRSSDNTLFRATYGWEPSTPLRLGIERTYNWIREEFLRG